MLWTDLVFNLCLKSAPFLHLYLTTVAKVPIISFLSHFISSLIDLPSDTLTSLWPVLTAKFYLLKYITSCLFLAPNLPPWCQSSLEFKSNSHLDLHQPATLWHLHLWVPPLLTGLQPCTSPCCFLNIPRGLLPQGLCTYCHFDVASDFLKYCCGFSLTAFRSLLKCHPIKEFHHGHAM